jgi:hypothetical protein
MPWEILLGCTSNRERSLKGAWTFIWHDNKPKYDQVIWAPQAHSKAQAAELATATIASDGRASRVCVAYSLDAVEEATRTIPTGGLYAYLKA